MLFPEVLLLRVAVEILLRVQESHFADDRAAVCAQEAAGINERGALRRNSVIMQRIIQKELEEGLRFLNQKMINYNNSLDCCIGNSGLKFSVDIPAIDLSFQMMEKFQPWRMIYSCV